MHFISTRGEAPRLSFEDTMLAGLARDGGLYVPERWPTLEPEAIRDLGGRHFADVVTRVMAPFIEGEIERAELDRLVTLAFEEFRHAAVTPLVQIDPNTWVLELFHGPTLAFKDVAMQVLARLMDHVLEKRGTRATIVGATSGDTGGAAIEAFRGSKNVDVVILYPDGRVSDVQRRMMTTPTEANVHAVAIDGTFDDAQALVKAMFNHHAFRDRVRLAGVNSINWARILAQVSYYFAAGAALGAPDRRASFVVPTGNFGDVFAGWVAKQMGLPIADLVIASNANDILPRTVRTGVYEMRDVQATTSPSMDIQISSNFERWLFEAGGRDPALVRRQMDQLRQSRRFELDTRQKAALARDFKGHAADEDAVAWAISAMAQRSGYVFDPHTACAYAAAVAMPGDRLIPTVVLATAHPAKFPEAVAPIIGRPPDMPLGRTDFLTMPERITRLPNDLGPVETFVASVSRVTGARP